VVTRERKYLTAGALVLIFMIRAMAGMGFGGKLHPNVVTAWMNGGMVFILIVFCAVVYFAPTIIAAAKKSRRAGAVAALNLFLGWTLIGWVVAIVWA
jgi:hypothetical protein